MKTLKEYINVEYTIHLVAEEFKIAYLSKIKKNLDPPINKRVNWEKTIALYSSMFGVNNELTTLLDKYDLNEDIRNIAGSDKLNGYETIGFVEAIIVFN